MGKFELKFIVFFLPVVIKAYLRSSIIVIDNCIRDSTERKFTIFIDRRKLTLTQLCRKLIILMQNLQSF